MSGSRIAVLSAEDACVVLDLAGPGLPRVLHWGAELGELTGSAASAGAAGTASSADDLAEVLGYDGSVPSPALIPSQGEGWYGRPALAGHRDGHSRPIRFALTEAVSVKTSAGQGGRVDVHAADTEVGLSLHTELEMSAQGVLRMRHALKNTDSQPYTLDRLLCAMPLPAQATEILDFAGRWARERAPQTAPLRQGVWSRESRRGRTGFDAGPLITGTRGFGFRAGRVWAAHAAWSGNHVHHVERLPEGFTALAAGELTEPGEVRLAPGEAYRTPWVYFGTSGTGLDGLSRAFHGMLRARPQHPQTPRPVTVNTWEAVYFDQRPDKLLDLARRAAELGAERFVVDDGWFRGRRDDRAGLGDWYADPALWPGGLRPLSDQVHGLGMQFGLWFEPEMVNPDSDLARAHPNWILADAARPPLEQRHQQVLDLARPEAFEYVLERVSTLVGEYALDYLKWDHNRDTAEPLHAGIPGVRAQILAVYRLLDTLRSRHPALEIESCSSGGARADLGILERTDRVWASDNLDPLTRQAILRWTGLLLPPELLGTHIGSSPSHTSGRAPALTLRCATALFGHSGVEADITAWDDADLAVLRDFIALHRRLRPLLHSGDTVRADHPDPAAWVHGVVAPDRGSAVFAYIQLDTGIAQETAPMRLPGLDPARAYRIEVLEPVSVGPELRPGWAQAARRDSGRPLTASGRVLAEAGIAGPRLANHPGASFVLGLTALGAEPTAG